MNLSGYTEEPSAFELLCYRGRVASAIRGQRGQEMLHALRSSLDAMPERALHRGTIETEQGEVCALGALSRHCKMDLKSSDDDRTKLSHMIEVPECLISEVMWENDEGGRYDETPEQRWRRMRAWVQSELTCRSTGEAIK